MPSTTRRPTGFPSTAAPTPIPSTLRRDRYNRMSGDHFPFWASKPSLYDGGFN
jgi:hypothetical protein